MSANTFDDEKVARRTVPKSLYLTKPTRSCRSQSSSAFSSHLAIHCATAARTVLASSCDKHARTSSTSPSTTIAPRSWWRTLIRRHPAAVSRASAWTPPTPASGATSIGVNPCSSRLPIRPLSPCITVPQPRSADVDSASRSGVGRQDPAPNSGCVRALHRSDLTSRRAPHDGAAVLAHRHAHNDDKAYRSTREHPPPAANTVRAAQDSPLLTNQERFASKPL
jgi:hypothetical protein